MELWAGEPTEDKIFSLAEQDIYTYAAKSFGFCVMPDLYDEAKVCKSTSFAKAMGGNIGEKGVSWWWLRSPGSYKNTAIIVHDGVLEAKGVFANEEYFTVRPALRLNLDAPVNYTYAGTVASNGLTDNH